jgi:hypothetical protein
MAKYKQIEFARMCGKDRTFLPPYIRNGKVIVEDGMVDDMNPINAFFLEKWSGRKKVDTADDTKEPVENKKPKNKSISEYQSLENQKKALDIEKIQEEIDLLKKKNMKMDGESVPTDAVKSIFSMYGKNMVVNFHSAAENWLTRIAKIHNLSDSTLAEMRGELSAGINEAVTKSQIESKKALDTIIKELSVKREVGEHD